jgi:hypothetical protein
LVGGGNPADWAETVDEKESARRIMTRVAEMGLKRQKILEIIAFRYLMISPLLSCGFI